ncbi:hypothetical protein NYQ83_14950 [Afifella sp. JA880]|uniref:hypothetical protein n=1 Tax=Afifella sp. JA880 TaxID=2975280 RepID=UPI0021BA8BE4|nr:hypothetical protein [Afifella sp. JA880]MCT8268576.1 hypothetical protein [Afifella sp. JA880]
MRHEFKKSDVHDLVQDILASEVADLRVAQINVRAASSCDGDDLIRIDVIFDGHAEDVDARKLVGLTRHILPRLRALDETGFPLFSFIALNEATGLMGDAA